MESYDANQSNQADIKLEVVHSNKNDFIWNHMMLIKVTRCYFSNPKKQKDDQSNQAAIKLEVVHSNKSDFTWNHMILIKVTRCYFSNTKNKKMIRTKRTKESSEQRPKNISFLWQPRAL